MSASQIALGVVIGGIVSSSFGSSLKNVDSSLTKYQDKIKSLNKDKLILKAQNDPKNAAAISSINQQLLALRKSAKIRIALESKKEDLIAQKNSLLAVLGTGYALSVPIRGAIEFESSMADVKKVVDFTDKLDFSNFSKELLGLTKIIPLSANELAQITASGGQLGIAKENLLDFTTTVAKMSTAFDMSASEAGDSIAKLMNVYGLSMNEVQGLGDSINHLSDNSAAKASQIVETLGRVGGVAKVFGLTSVQAGALSSAFIALGKPPEVAATAINSLLLKLKTADKQGDKFREALRGIGLDATELKNSVDKDAQGALSNFLKTLEKLDKTEQMGVLSDLFGAEFSDDMALLVGGLENYNKALNLTADSSKYAGSMQREFQTRSETTSNSLKLLSNSISTISINFGSLLLPAINSVLKPVTYLSNLIGGFATEFPILSSSISGAVVGMFALVAVTKLATVTKTLFSMAFLTTKGVLMGYPIILSVLKVSYLALGSALKLAGTSALWLGRALMANPIGLAIGAIVMGATLIYTYWEPIKGFFSNLWVGIKGFFNDGLNVIKNIFSFSPLGLVFNSFEPIKGFFSGFWDGIKGLFDDGLNVIKNIFSFSPLEIIKNAWSGVFDWFSAKFDFVLNGIEKLKNMGANVKDFFTFGSDKKSEDKTEVKKEVKNTEILKNAGDGKTVALGTGYTQALENSVNNSNYKTSNTNYTNNTSNNKKSESSTVVVNINNPTVQTKEQVKALEQDIKKAVDVALKEKERSNMNRTFKDVA